MEAIGRVAACACGVSIALTLAELAAPSQQFLRQLRLLFALLLGIGILLPFTKGEISLTEAMQTAETAGEVVLPERFEATLVEEETAARLRDVLLDSLHAEGISCSSLEPLVHISDEGSITISEVRLSSSDHAAAARLLHALLGAQVPVTETEGTP